MEITGSKELCSVTLAELKWSWQLDFIWKIVFQTLIYHINQKQENNNRIMILDA